MPKLDHSGPEGKGSKTGRKLGRCARGEEELKGKLGEGMAKCRKDDYGKGKGKRSRSNMP